MSNHSGKCNVPCHFVIYMLLLIFGGVITLFAISSIPAAKAWVCKKEMKEAWACKEEVAVLEKRIVHLLNSPILMPAPNSPDTFLVIFHKETLLEKVQVNNSQLRLTQVKKGFKSFDSYQQYDDCFAFLLTKEQAEDPFIIEYLDDGVWLPAAIL